MKKKKKRKGQTQREWVEKMLRRGKVLTPVDAHEGCGCLRLGAVIGEIRKDGIEVEMERVDLGNGRHVGSYYIEG